MKFSCVEDNEKKLCTLDKLLLTANTMKQTIQDRLYCSASMV